MGLLDKNKRRQQQPQAGFNFGAPPRSAPPPPPPEPPSEEIPAEEGIDLVDQEGRRIRITKDVFRTQVLPQSFKAAWENPEALYQTILMCLQTGFLADTIPAAERLAEIDPIPERSANTLAVLYMSTNQMERARAVLSEFINKHGKTSLILTNYAKVQALLGDEAAARGSLWEAVQADPNQDHALLGWAQLRKEKEGDDGFYRAMEEAAALPNSWRAKLWVARRALEQKNLDAARALYEEILNTAPPQSEAMMMISGDLGHQGFVAEIVNLCLPRFKLEEHGLMAAVNIAQACLDQKMKGEGLSVLDQAEPVARQANREELTQRLGQLRQALERL